MQKTVAFTIASKNFLSFVHVLHSSLSKYHPEIDFYCVLCDDPEGLDVKSLPFEVIFIEGLGIPSIEAMKVNYNITELNTALKPFAFSTIFGRHPGAAVLYFDPDILVLSRMSELLDAIQSGANAVLTPHITEPAEHAEMSGQAFLRYGIYNLGFCGLRDTSETRRVVSWWGRRLEKECVIDLPNGLFVDQKWADLLPAFVADTKILRHPGYNVAYWNLSQRKVVRREGAWLVNGLPLRFFHFSGGSAEDSAPFSRHSKMFTMARIGDAKHLVLDYRAQVQEAGYKKYKAMPYAYSCNAASGQNERTLQVGD